MRYPPMISHVPSHPPALDMLIALGIKSARGKLPRWRLAMKAGVTPATIGRIERRAVPDDPGSAKPSLDMVERIASALGVSSLELIQRGAAVAAGSEAA